MVYILSFVTDTFGTVVTSIDVFTLKIVQAGTLSKLGSVVTSDPPNG